MTTETSARHFFYETFNILIFGAMLIASAVFLYTGIGLAGDMFTGWDGLGMAILCLMAIGALNVLPILGFLIWRFLRAQDGHTTRGYGRWGWIFASVFGLVNLGSLVLIGIKGGLNLSPEFLGVVALGLVPLGFAVSLLNKAWSSARLVP